MAACLLLTVLLSRVKAAGGFSSGRMMGYENRLFDTGSVHAIDIVMEDWDGFIEKYREFITEETLLFERTYDDPAVTSYGHCLYDICMSVQENCPLKNTAKIQCGKCIVYHFKGNAKHIYAAYQTIFLVWLPRVSYELDATKSLFDIYHEVDSETLYMELDICVPVK